MTRFHLLIAFAFCAIFSHAQTIEVSGLQSGVWKADTVFVVDDIKVQDSLRILPGTKVLFKDFYSITVKSGATLKAIGTKNDTILFSVVDTTDFHIFNAGKGGWNGIRLENAGPSRFDFCRFQFGKAALDTDQDGGALRIFSCDEVEVSNSTLFCNLTREHGGALNAEDSKVMMHNCKVNHNIAYSEIDTIYFMYGGGLRFLKCRVDLTDMEFRYNQGAQAIGGALSLDSCAVCIDRCKFEHNIGINGGGLYLIRSNDWECSITNSLFANNTSGHFGGGMAISDSSPLISNVTVVNNHSIGVNCGGIFFFQYSSPVLWNCIVYGNTNDALIEEPVQMWAWTYEDDAPQFHNCLVQFGLQNVTNHEYILVYENCYDDDPLFVDPEHEDFHLRDDSPCIDAGAPETPAEVLNGLDLDRYGRVNGSLIDLGAYEYDLTGLAETVQDRKPIRIVGNPITAASYAELELENEGVLSARVYAMDGKLLVSNGLGAVRSGINRMAIGEWFAPLPSGTYLLVFEVNGETFVTKVVK